MHLAFMDPLAFAIFTKLLSTHRAWMHGPEGGNGNLADLWQIRAEFVRNGERRLSGHAQVCAILHIIGGLKSQLR